MKLIRVRFLSCLFDFFLGIHIFSHISFYLWEFYFFKLRLPYTMTRNINYPNAIFDLFYFALFRLFVCLFKRKLQNKTNKRCIHMWHIEMPASACPHIIPAGKCGKI